MSVTCGFYNSIGGDRKYNSFQMSKIFDGIIKDGIFMSIGDAFMVTANSGTTVKVGSGKCWFNHTWTENDAPLLIDCGKSNSLMGREDYIVIKIDSSDTGRNNTIECINGTPSKWPQPPELINTNDVHYYPIFRIHREAGSTEITQSDIYDLRGTNTPYLTGILKTLDSEQLFVQWRAKLDEFVSKEEQDLDVFMSNQKSEYNQWYSEMKMLMDAVVSETNTWNENQRNTILTWFADIQDLLESNTAIKLENHLNKSDVERMLVVGLTDGDKTFSEDGLTITTVDSTGRRLVKTFTSDFSSCTTILYASQGGELGRLVKQFSSDGNTISSEVTII